ncbi:MAG: chromosome partitioning protein ParB [Phenylobacterium sp.]|uniref:ParB/RepB/Spo0J family partition protein n=1 Tax=Phenylobacterium sp. TaxID=1871053 RepID=UPI0025CE2736|nr:ParB N-terminal domain-containing protein [Phenylobacterium sp.]MBI1200356.1 chromosome partitioning protein ParB [Phenylobacterium sp.]
MSANPSTPEPAAPRLPKLFALGDLDVAPENLRAGEPPDAAIPELAATLRAAGLLQPLTVRPGKRREKPAMVLDGRRRLLALRTLRDAGEIGDDFPVAAFEETTAERQAAAVVLTNTGVPVHVADVVVAIGRMLKAKLTPPMVAAALGYAEIEVRRLAALAGLHPKALEALKAGRLNLRQARLLARLPHRQEQGEIAEAALNGFGFPEWRITDRLDAGQVTVRDRRFRLVGAARYAAAGGRVESDLFGERPDVVLDPAILQDAWTARAATLAEGLGGAGVTVQVEVAPSEVEDPDLTPFGEAYGLGLDAEALAAWDAAQEAQAEAAEALEDLDWASEAADPALGAWLAAKLAAERAGEPPRELSLVQVFADGRTGLDLRAFGPASAELDPQAETTDDDTSDADGTVAWPRRSEPAAPAPVAVAPRPQLEGVGHALHETRTDVATRALIRALADDPGAALTALAARLFAVLVLARDRARGGGALTLTAEAYGRPRSPPIPALDGDVRRRLAERRATWEGSGLSPIAWAAGLAHGEKMALLAELVALSLDLREERTSAVRAAARAEAVEIAALCQADVTLHWTPDAAFLGAHPKAQLLEMLEAMGAGTAQAGACRKTELVALVAEAAAERGWAPPELSWAAEAPDDASGDDASTSGEPTEDDPDARSA